MRFLPFLLIVASGIITSCQNNTDSGNDQNGSDTVVTGLEGTRDQQAQISEVKIDTTSGQHPAGGSSDSATGSSGADDQFIKDQVVGNYNELAIARLAVKKSADKEVKKIAQQLVSDHSKVLDSFKGIGSAKKLELASAASQDGTALTSDLDKKQGAAFDKAWIEALIEKHKAGVAKYEAASRSVSDTDVKDLVNKTLPKLRMHLDMLMAYHSQVK
jgi:putative membrane protein